MTNMLGLKYLCSQQLLLHVVVAVTALTMSVLVLCPLNGVDAQCYDARGGHEIYTDCVNAYKSGNHFSGVYTIKPDNLPAFEVYCDMETDNGGWVVFQRRMDGTENFYRGWADYVKGFGDLNGEFWLGLNKIHRLTKNTNVRVNLRVDMEDFEGNVRYAKYSTFRVLDSSRAYELYVTGYTGNAGDNLTGLSGRKFTTLDQDNDSYKKGNCAVMYKGAWWYNACHHSNLNGHYLSGAHTSYADGVNWHDFKGYHYSLKVTEMKLRQ